MLAFSPKNIDLYRKKMYHQKYFVQTVLLMTCHAEMYEMMPRLICFTQKIRLW